MNKELKQRVEEVKEDIERREELRGIAEEDKELLKKLE